MSETTTELDQIFDEPEAAAPTPAPEQAPAPQPTAPTGETTPTSAAPPADATKTASDGEWTKQAVMDERRKRQELERRVAEYEKQLQDAQRPPEQRPDWITDPDRAAEFMRAEMEQRDYRQRIVFSEALVKQQHPDFDEVTDVFAEAAMSNPHLLRQMEQHPMPAQYAYQAGKRLQFLKDVGEDPGAYRARLEAEILAQHGIAPQQPQGGQTTTTPQARAAPVPKSLARDTSQIPRKANGQFDGPASLDEILG